MVVVIWRLSAFKEKESPKGLTSDNEDGRVNFSYYGKGVSEFYTVNSNGIVTWEGTSEIFDTNKISELISLAKSIILDSTKTKTTDADHVFDDVAIMKRIYVAANVQDATQKDSLNDVDKILSDIEDEVKGISAYYASGRKREENGDLEGAIKDYSKAIKLSPNNQFILNSRGVAKSNNGDASGAIKDFTKALGIAPHDPLILMNRGLAKSDLKDYQGAIDDYTKALEINPQDALAYKNRGIAKELVGDLKGACADWRKASSLGDKDAAGWVRDQCQ